MTIIRDQKGRFVGHGEAIALGLITEPKLSRVEKAAQKATFENFRHAAASISKDAKESILKIEGPSAEGEPPHTHKRVFLRRAIRWAADKVGAVIGPVFSLVGGSGAAHEFGGEYKDQEFPERSYMGPALDRAVPRFAGQWRGSIGE